MIVTSKVVVSASQGGRLVVVPLGRGVGVKMLEEEARRLGLWPPAEIKAQKPTRNKARQPERTKDEG